MMINRCRLFKDNGLTAAYSRRTLTSLKSIEGFRSNVEKHRKATEEKRNLILSILKSTSGKREARHYLQKYSLLKDLDENDQRINYEDINDFKLSIRHQKQKLESKTKYDRIIDNLIQGDHPQEIPLVQKNDTELELSETLRILLIKIRNFEDLSTETLNGIGLTIYGMVRLGVSPIIVMDNDDDFKATSRPSFSQLTFKIVEQSNKLIEAINFSTKDKNYKLESRSVRGAFEINDDGILNMTMPESLLIPLSQGILPIVYPLLYNKATSGQELLTSELVLDCLIRDLVAYDETEIVNEQLFSIEKIIFIEPEGGIPSLERFKSAHVLVNLEQEYQDIQSELHIGFLKPAIRDIHLNNLHLMKQLLDLLPSSTTGLITTPEIATLQSKTKYTNPIIYNVLTDRPVISSSLPVNLAKTPLLNTTIIRKGMPIDIIYSRKGVDLKNNPNIDLSKLENLINDSFRRKLDLDHYLERVNGHVLCVIIAGDYQGAAIVTRELEDGIPYLDKFAVSTVSQGSSGVADIVFKSLLTQFSDKLIWRSRKTNPVNKWYFERSNFNLSLPGDSNWKLFYSGTEPLKLQDLDKYVKICDSIEPSWLE